MTVRILTGVSHCRVPLLLTARLHVTVFRALSNSHTEAVPQYTEIAQIDTAVLLSRLNEQGGYPQETSKLVRSTLYLPLYLERTGPSGLSPPRVSHGYDRHQLGCPTM